MTRLDLTGHIKNGQPHSFIPARNSWTWVVDQAGKRENKNVRLFFFLVGWWWIRETRFRYFGGVGEVYSSWIWSAGLEWGDCLWSAGSTRIMASTRLSIYFFLLSPFNNKNSREEKDRDSILYLTDSGWWRQLPVHLIEGRHWNDWIGLFLFLYVFFSSFFDLIWFHLAFILLLDGYINKRR